MNILDELRRPFHPSHISFKPGATKGTSAMALAYADLRAYMQRLDEVCGQDWQVSYEPWGADRIICQLTIAGTTRASTGEMTAQDEKGEIGGTAAEAQAFKRACAMFGLGRYLYNLPSPWADFDPQRKQFTDAGKAKLSAMLTQHYREATKDTQKAQKAQEKRNAVDALDNPFEDATPYFVSDWRKLTGKHYDLVKWVATLHDKSDGPCSAKQYQYLTGIVDKLTGSEHNYVLSLLCQAEISSDNLPGRKVAASLLEILPETVKVMDVEQPNEKHRPDICELIKQMAEKAHQPQPESVAA